MWFEFFLRLKFFYLPIVSSSGKRVDFIEFSLILIQRKFHLKSHSSYTFNNLKKKKKRRKIGRETIEKTARQILSDTRIPMLSPNVLHRIQRYPCESRRTDRRDDPILSSIRKLLEKEMGYVAGHGNREGHASWLCKYMRECLKPGKLGRVSFSVPRFLDFFLPRWPRCAADSR